MDTVATTAPYPVCAQQSSYRPLCRLSSGVCCPHAPSGHFRCLLPPAALRPRQVSTAPMPMPPQASAPMPPQAFAPMSSARTPPPPRPWPHVLCPQAPLPRPRLPCPSGLSPHAPSGLGPHVLCPHVPPPRPLPPCLPRPLPPCPSHPCPPQASALMPPQPRVVKLHTST